MTLSQELGLSKEAEQFICLLFEITQFIDDVHDNQVKKSQAYENVYRILYDWPSNTFLQRHATFLLPVIAVQIGKWQAANYAEAHGLADEKSYNWRAGFYDVLVAVIQLEQGVENIEQKAQIALSCYAETFASYQEEFKNGQ